MNKTLEGLTETIYAAAVAFKEAEEKNPGEKWLLAARWGDYTRALGAHAQYLVDEYKQAQAEGTE